MTKEQFEIALGRLKVIGSACYGLVSDEDIRMIAARVAPQATPEDLVGLEEACRQTHQVMRSEEKQRLLEEKCRAIPAVAQPAKAEEASDDFEIGALFTSEERDLIHRALGILLSRRERIEVKDAWKTDMKENPQFRGMLDLWTDHDRRDLAEALELSEDALCLRERQMIQEYYARAHQVWRANR